jgi:hypothetical protein
MARARWCVNAGRTRVSNSTGVAVKQCQVRWLYGRSQLAYPPSERWGIYLGYEPWPATVARVHVALRSLIWALVLCWFLGGPTAAVAGTARPGAVELEDEAEVESGGAASRRVPCEQVIAHIDHERKPNHVADSAETARQMHTSVLWVDRCMQAYGRRMQKAVHSSAEAREHRLEGFEEDEPEEVGSEEVGEMDTQDRIELRRLRPHPDKEQTLRSNIKPTPGADEGDY